jgi:hypothetical protein
LTWTTTILVFFFCHLAGDFVLQTDWQATHKAHGLGRNPVARRALFTHVGTYLVPYVPAFVWVSSHIGAGATIGVVALIAGPHLFVDDRRAVGAWMRHVKGFVDPPPGLSIAVDQSFHLLFLAGAALAAARF